MNIGIIEMYFLIVVVFVCIFILRRESTKYAETKNITRLDIGEENERREYVASGLNDNDYHGTKILMILYSLYCRRCGSSDIFAEISDTNEHIQVYCRKCGYTTLIPLKKMLIHEDVPEGEEDVDEQELVKQYIHILHEKHEVDVIDPPYAKHKETKNHTDTK